MTINLFQQESNGVRTDKASAAGGEDLSTAHYNPYFSWRKVTTA